MNLLIIDDEEYVIRSIQQNVDWESIGIDKIYTATTKEQVWYIMDMQSIQIILSDIVMPQCTGLELVEHLRKKGYKSQVIFLTSYAKFEFAKQAIELDSVDYLLKPINFSALTDALKKAKEKAESFEGYKDYQDKKRQWKRTHQILANKFWKYVVSNKLEKTQIEEEIEKYGLNIQKNAIYFPVLICLFYKKEETWDETMLQFILENVSAEIFYDYKIMIDAIFKVSQGEYIIICRSLLRYGNEKEEIDDKPFEQYINWIKSNLRADTWCGIGESAILERMYYSVKKLESMRENSLSVKNRILYQVNFIEPQRQNKNVDMYSWQELLREHKSQELLENMKVYLQDLDENEMITRDILKTFRIDLIQLIYTHLSKKEIKAHLLFTNPEEELYYQKALDSSRNALEFAQYLINKAVEYESYISHSESVAEQLKTYIDEHYQEEIRRDDLAEQVYLNVDYMSRIFKKETGISISTYLIQKRVEEAKRLLSKSSLPVNAISIQVGYSNFSYFTKMFKENTGYSPLEYRRKYLK